VFLLFLSVSEAETVIKSSGILDAKMYSGKTVMQSESSKNSFISTVAVDGKWLLAIYPVYEKGNPLYGKTNVIYMAFDGIDTFFCEYTEAVIELKDGKPTLVTTKPISERRLQSYVSPGNYPFSPLDSQRRGHVLWLVYGLGHKIHDSGVKSIPLPWYPARSTPLAFGYRMDSSFSTSAPYFPQSIAFHRDFDLDLPNEDEELQRPEMDLARSGASFANRRDDLNIRKSKWKGGDLAGSLTVESRTNIAEFTVPTAVSIKTFASFGRLRRQYQVTVTNVLVEEIGTNSDEEFRPPILTKLLISDSRFRLRNAGKNVDFINYKLEKDQKWLAVQSPELTNLFMAYAGNDNFSSRRSLFSRFSAKNIVLLVLVGTSAILLIILFRKFLFKQTKERMQKETKQEML
jgi:hypothetical protein